MLWVLVVVQHFFISGNLNYSVTFQEFGNQERCELVAKDLNKRDMKAYCVKK